jgi:hypothetical protein
MERGKYFRTRAGQVSTLGKRRLRRFTLMLDQEPQSKNIRAADAVAFQRAVLDQLRVAGQSAYRGPVFLQMDFFTAARNPPAIYNLPKNYLDLLEKPLEGSGICLPRLFYRDDRQVKALVVRYHLWGLSSKPGVRVQAEPFRDFLADIDLVERIRRDDFEDDGRWRCRSNFDDLRNGPFHDDWEPDDDGFRRLAEFERDRQSVTRILSGDAYEIQRQMMRMDAQQAHLWQTDHLTCSGLLWAFQNTPKSKGDPPDNFMNRLAFTMREMTFGPPFTVELHHAPYRKGDSVAFDKALRAALNDFKTKHRYLFPLSSLLNVTILMIPPEDGGKDLDNLARLILPALHEIWAPPSDFAHAFKTDNIQEEDVRDHWEKVRAGLPKEPKYSITEYRAFELPRLPADPKDGFVRLAIGDGMRPVRFREEIDEYLEKWEDAVKC